MFLYSIKFFFIFFSSLLKQHTFILIDTIRLNNYKKKYEKQGLLESYNNYDEEKLQKTNLNSTIHSKNNQKEIEFQLKK